MRCTSHRGIPQESSPRQGWWSEDRILPPWQEVQQSLKAQVDELHQAATTREEQYQTDIAAEVDRREAAEQLAADHAATVSELEAQIDNLGEEMAEIEAERDAQIEALRVELEKEGRFLAIFTSTRTSAFQ